MKINLSSFLQLRFNIFMCKKLGWKITFFYITILGKLYFFFKRKEKRKIKSSVKEVFAGQKSGSEIRSITRDIFRGIVSHYYEKFFNAYSKKDWYILKKHEDMVERTEAEVLKLFEFCDQTSSLKIQA